MFEQSNGLHIFVFFKEPVSAKLVIPALRHWAVRLGLTKFEIFPTNDGTGGFHVQERCLWPDLGRVAPAEKPSISMAARLCRKRRCFRIEGMRITAEDLPKQESKQQESKSQSRQIPMALQAAIDSIGPYPFDPIEGKRHRSPVTASIIWQLRDLGFDADAIETNGRGSWAFCSQRGANRSLSGDIARIIQNYDLRHSNKDAQSTPLQIQSSAEFINDFVPP